MREAELGGFGSVGRGVDGWYAGGGTGEVGVLSLRGRLVSLCEGFGSGTWGDVAAGDRKK